MKEQRNGLLLVVSGPSGVGKGTLVKALMDRNSKIKMSVSATTREPRPGEIEGVHYFFKSEEEFKAMADRGEFLEYIHVFGSKYYGTPRSFVEQHLSNGYDVILEIDVQGAMKVKQSFPDAVLMFITAPSMSEIKSRLIGRGTEKDDPAVRLRDHQRRGGRGRAPHGSHFGSGAVPHRPQHLCYRSNRGNWEVNHYDESSAGLRAG